MPDASDHRPEDTAMIEAAAKHWTAMAAFAWTSSEQSGPGAVVIHRDDLAVETPTTATPGVQAPAPPMQWFAAEDIPKGDDFRTLMLQCDAQRQVVLIVVDEHGDQALVLEADETHPNPPQCAATLGEIG